MAVLRCAYWWLVIAMYLTYLPIGFGCLMLDLLTTSPLFAGGLILS
jgi:hypothetical protein